MHYAPILWVHTDGDKDDGAGATNSIILKTRMMAFWWWQLVRCNRRCKAAVKSSPPPTENTQLFTRRMSFAQPTVESTEGRKYHVPQTCSRSPQAHLESSILSCRICL